MHRIKLIFFIAAMVLWGQSVSAVDKSEAEFAKTAQLIVSEFTQRQTSAFDQALDANSIIATALDDLALDASWKERLRGEFVKVIKTKLGAKLISEMPDGAYARLVRVKTDKAAATALIRFDYGDNGTGYIDVHLHRDKQGAVRIIDWYDYSTGQLYTQSVRQLIALMSPTPTVLGKLFDAVSNRKENINAVVRLIHLKKEQKYADVVETFLSLDEDMRKDRMLNILAVQAANMSNDDTLYHKALANLDRHYQNDPSMAFLLIDYYFLEEKYDKALSALDKVHDSFGAEDAALLSLKANTLFSAKKYQKAVLQAERAISIEPEYEASYWSLLNALILDRKFDKAVVVAKELESGFGYDMGPESLSGVPSFLPLVESRDYKNWRAKK